MKSIILLSVILGFVCQADGVTPKNPASALKEIRKRYKAIQTFRCDFTEQFQWQFTGELVTRNGAIVAIGGDRFRMETPEQVMVCDGEILYRYNPLKNQVMLETVKQSTNLLPGRMLLELGEGFEAATITPISVIGQEGYRLDLKPIKADESLMASASIWVTSGDLVVRKMQMDDLNGNRTTYILQNIVLDGPVEKRETTFIIPEGAELFDLR